MSDCVIKVENLCKSYLVGHQSSQREKYTSLREVIVREVHSFARKAADVVRGRQIVQGDEIEEFWALRDVSFEVKQGDVVGIIGRNGAGKSTLLKILSRITEPTKGRVLLRGRVASLLEVGTGFHNELTGRENIFLNGAILGMTQREIRRKFDEIVTFAEVERFLDTPVKRYSSGMYVRLAFAVAAHLEPEILIVDEVLAVGDAEFQKKCIGKMNEVSRRDERTVLVVSHNMDIISRLCTRVLWLNQGSVNSFAETTSVVADYQMRQHHFLQPRWSRSETWVPPHEIGFIAIDIFDEHKTSTSSFFFGQDFLVRIALRNQSSSPIRCVTGIEFSTEDGYSLMTTHSNDRDQIRELPAGDSVIECRVSPNPLMPGKYALRMGLVDHAWSLLDLIDPGLTIEIKTVASHARTMSPRRPGRIALSLDWTEIR